MTTELLFGIASGTAALWFIVHLFAGGKEVVLPLRAERHLDPVVRDTLHLGWHFVSISIAAMCLLFFLAIFAGKHEYAAAGTVLAWGFTLVGIAQIPAIGARYRDLPQGWLFLPIALLGSVGLCL